MPLILPGNVASAIGGGYEVANSCRFNIADSAYLTTKTNGSEPTLGTKYTVSVWLKRSTLVNSSYQYIISHDGGSNPRTHIRFNDDADNLTWYIRDSGGTTSNLTATRLFRDTNAWYHLVFAYDSTQASASNRQKIYVNGTQNTSFSSSGYVAQDVVNPFSANGNASKIASFGGTASDYYGGYMSEFVFVDGQALTPTSFGEFDEDSPTIWKPIDVSGLTFGNNGYYLDFEDSANLGNDANGGTDFTENNLAAADQATDTPTNNFATANPLLVNTSNAPTFSEGNCKIADSSASRFGFASTIGVTTGKWYAEYKLSGISGDDENFYGVGDEEAVQENARNNNSTSSAGNIVYIKSGTGDSGSGAMKRVMSAGSGTDTDDFFNDDPAANDILQIALNKTDGYVFFGINGTWLNSDDPTSSGSGSNGVALPNHAGKTFFFTAATHSGSSGNDIEINFGNPPFSISSGNADGNGYGNMEYAIPSGYYTLCTKNLAEFG
jgi:hypothetical protein